jgi:hypothetical protein
MLGGGPLPLGLLRPRMLPGVEQRSRVEGLCLQEPLQQGRSCHLSMQSIQRLSALRSLALLSPQVGVPLVSAACYSDLHLS